MTTARTRYHVERFGCYEAGPYDTEDEAHAYIDAQPIGLRATFDVIEYQVKPHPLGDDLDSALVRWIVVCTLVFVFGVLALSALGYLR